MTLEFILKIGGMLLGVLARMLLPWLRKLIAGEATGFSRRYLYQSLASFILGIIITMLIFPKFEAWAGTYSPDPSSSPGFEAYFKLFCIAFGFGFGWNSLVIEAGQWPASLRHHKFRKFNRNKR